MKSFSFALSGLLMALVSWGALPARAHAPRDTGWAGIEMKLAFHHLEPGHQYHLRMTNPAWFSGEIQGAPTGTHLTWTDLDFKAPSSEVSFSVGIVPTINDASGGFAVDLPEHASVDISIHERASSHGYWIVKQTLRGRETAPLGKSAAAAYDTPPSSCLLAPTCTLTSKCPTRPPGQPRVRCFGPRQSEFYCCTHDPFSL